MKKTTFLLALVLCVQLLCSTQAFAAGETFDLYYETDKTSYEVGDTITLTVHLDRTDSSDDHLMYTFQDYVLYNHFYFEYLGCASKATAIRVADTGTQLNPEYSRVSMIYYNTSAQPLTRPAKLTVATLRFKALARIHDISLFHMSPLVQSNGLSDAALTTRDAAVLIGDPNAAVYAVAFSGGADAVGTAPKVSDKAAGDVFSLPVNPFTRTGYTFAGWSDGAAVYQPRTNYTMPGTAVTFTAQWTKDPVKHTVTFAPDGAAGEAPVMGDCFAGTVLSLPTKNTLAKTNSKFIGWKYGDKVYQPGDTFTMPDSDVTFTAQWQAVETGTGGTGTSGSWTNPFVDVKDGAWYYDYVKYAQTKGLMGSVGDDRFDPDGLMTRAMIVTILYRAAGSPAVTASNPFSDVPAGQWYTDAVVWASESKLVTGYGEGKFGPADTLTRQQMLAILWRYAGSPASGDQTAAAAKFSDWSTVAAWAQSAAAWATEKSIVNGMDGKLVPDGSATRAQFAAIMARIGSTK